MSAAVMIRAGWLCKLGRAGAGLRWISSRGEPEKSERPQGAEARLRCFRLACRSLLHIQGPDTGSFLQGIITNDMKLLEEGKTALYAHLLNVQGRTLYDVIIYSLQETSDDLSGVLLECDASVLDSMTQHLKVYKIRRKVTVSTRSDLALWALLPPITNSTQDHLEPKLNMAERPLVLVQDPRTELMGWRLITRNENPPELITTCKREEPDQYHTHRYLIGLPEGVRDLPPGEALPLESNLVFMNGISFSKGCYIGQELTARTHHTGVIRKRLLPVSLSVSAQSLQPGGALESGEGKPAGKFRAGLGSVGLGLVRLAHAKDLLTHTSSTHTSVTVQPSEPDWWPKDGVKK